MASPNEEWLTQDTIAKMLDIPIERIRPIVAALAALKQIKTTTNVKDKRYVLVHRDAVPLIRQAIYGE